VTDAHRGHSLNCHNATSLQVEVLGKLDCLLIGVREECEEVTRDIAGEGGHDEWFGLGGGEHLSDFLDYLCNIGQSGTSRGKEWTVPQVALYSNSPVLF